MAMASGNRWRRSGVAGLLLGVLLLTLLRVENSLPARDKAKVPALPSDLVKVPSDSAFLLSVRVADLWGSDLVQPIRRKLAKDIGEASGAFEKNFGLPLQQVERWTMVSVSPPAGPAEPLMFVHTTQAYDRAKVLAAHKNVQEEKYKGQTFYSADKKWAVYPLDERSLVYGSPNELRGLIDHPAPKTEGNLAGALRLAAGKHTLTAAANVKAINNAVGGQLPGEAEPFKPLLQALSGTLTVDVGAESPVQAKLIFPTEADAKAAVKPANTGVDLAAHRPRPWDGGVGEAERCKQDRRIAQRGPNGLEGRPHRTGGQDAASLGRAQGQRRLGRRLIDGGDPAGPRRGLPRRAATTSSRLPSPCTIPTIPTANSRHELPSTRTASRC